VHQGSLGDDCASCHTPNQWSQTGFDHLSNTGFGLLGAHAQAECTDCHAATATAALPTDCAGCHAPDPHQNQLGADCAGCHAETAWNADVLFDHGLSHFPLIGAHAEVACADCHMPYERVGALKVSDHHVRSPLLMLEQSCQTCHKISEEELRVRVYTIQDRTFELRNIAIDALLELIQGIETARAADSASATVRIAQRYQRAAQFFADFVEAFAFMTAGALCAERKNHHPEWFNVYKTVRVDLSTHDLGGISTWDVELAREFDAAAG